MENLSQPEGDNPGDGLSESSEDRSRTVRGQSTVIYVFETKGYTSNDVLLTIYTIQIYM